MADRTPSPSRSDVSTNSTQSLRYQNILNNNNVDDGHKLHKRKISLESPSSPEQRYSQKRTRKDNYHVITMKRRLLDSPSSPDQISPVSKMRRRDDSQDEDNEGTRSPQSSMLLFGGASSDGGSNMSNSHMVIPSPNRKSTSSAAPPSSSSLRSNSTPTKQLLQAQKTRTPKCAQCLNHGMMEKVKGHKRYCPWNGCRCFKCNVTYERRKVMANQVAVRRAQAQDDARAKEYTSTQIRDEARAAEYMNNNSTSQGPEVKHPHLFAPYQSDRKGMIGRRDSGGAIPPFPMSLSLPPHSEYLPRTGHVQSLHQPHIPYHHSHLNMIHSSAVNNSGNRGSSSRNYKNDDENTTPHPIVISPPTSSVGDKRDSQSDTEVDSVDNKSVEGRSSLSRSTIDRDSIRGRSPKSGEASTSLREQNRRLASPNLPVGITNIPSTSGETVLPLPVKNFGTVASRGNSNPSSSIIRTGWQPLMDPLLAKMHLQHQAGTNGTNITTFMALPPSGSESGVGSSSAMTSPSSMAAVAAAAAAACGVDPTTPPFSTLKMYPHFGLQGAEALAVIAERKESVNALMSLYKLPSEMDFLVYRILKDSNDDFKLASSKIFEAQCEMRTYELIREAARAGYPYYHAAAAATSAYYYHHPVTGATSTGNPGTSHSSTTPPDLYNSINSSSNHRINQSIAANTEKVQVAPALPTVEDTTTTLKSEHNS